MKKLFINIILFFVAVILLLTVGVFGLVYTFFVTIFNFKKYSFINYWSNMLYAINVGIDKIGNVILALFLNFLFLKNKNLYPFGSVKHTISHVLAVNLIDYNNLTKSGHIMVNILEFIDNNHMKKSLKL